MVFALVVLTVWMVYTLFLKKRKKKSFRFYKAVLPLLLFSIIISIDLGVNYLSPYNIQSHDGSIGIDGIFAYNIIGDSGWSTELFRGFFTGSMLVSVILLLTYTVLRLVEE